MPGKKDRKRERGGGGDGGLASLLGLTGMPDVSNDDLEAEFLAMTGGKGSGKKKGKSGSNQMSMDDIDKVVASVKDIGEGDDDDEDLGSLSDIDDDDLLAELQGMEEEDDEPEEEVSPPMIKKPHVSPTKPITNIPSPKPKSGGGDQQTIQDRLQMYETAIAAAKSKGESSSKKVRRYDRGLKTLKEMAKDVKAGKKVKMDDLPPEVFVSGGEGGEGAGEGQVTNITKEEEEDDLAQLSAWVTGASPQHQQSSQSTGYAPPTKKPSVDTGVIQDRLKMYNDVLKEAESQKDTSKIRRYKRAIGTIDDMLKATRGGRPINMEELPPIVSLGPPTKPPVTVSQPLSQPPTTSTKPTPSSQTGQTGPGNLIDLDAPEFDEFNLSEEDMAILMASFADDRGSKTTPTNPVPVTQTTPTTQQPKPPPPKPAPKPQPRTSQPQPRPPGLIDLDTPEFSEFDLSDADIEAMAGMLVDDRTKPKEQVVSTSRPPPDRTTQSLPTKPPIQTGGGGVVSKDQVRAVLVERKDQYMKAMQKARSQGDSKTQKKYGMVAVQFERALKSIDSNQPLDLRGIPPPPPGFSSKYNIDISQYNTQPRPPPTTMTDSPQSSVSSQSGAGGGDTQEEEEGGVDPSIPLPKTPLEALQQRLEKYREGLKNAQEKGETSRARRSTRIIKQYETAIKMTKAGKPYDFSELPTPPGYPPIPTGSRPTGTSQPRPNPVQSLPVGVPAIKLRPSVSDRQLQAIQERGAEFQQAAKQAKAKGDRDKALMYLRYYKSIQQILQAAEGGLPVDMTQLPPSPFGDPSKAGPTKSILSHLGPAKEGDDKTFDLIEQQLQEQIEVCTSNADIYQQLGNIAASSQHKNMADQCQRDLLAIKGIRSQDLAPPKFTMELREFAIVHSNPGISDKKIEVELARGITIPAPSGLTESDMNIYVEVEFPWPQDSIQKFETDSIKGSSSPQFNRKELLDIDRKAGRSMLRILKRHPLKCSIYQRRTLRKDIFIGQALVPLESLETKCEVHVTEDLKDEKGRKPIGGKLEVFVRLREPLSGRDQEVKKQKWLVFQEPIATEPTVSMLRPTAGATGSGGVTSPIKIEQTTSLEALKLELSIVQSALKAGKKDPSIIQRGQAIQSRTKLIKQKLQDPSYKREYLTAITRELKAEKVFEQQLVQAGRTGEAKVVQGRRRMMENELSKAQKK